MGSRFVLLLSVFVVFHSGPAQARFAPVKAIKARLANWQFSRLDGQLKALARRNRVYNNGGSMKMVARRSSAGEISAGEVARLDRRISRLHFCLKAQEKGSKATQSLGRRLSKMTPIPRIHVPVEISRNLWGEEGFDPRYVALMGRYSQMTQRYSDLHALSSHLGIRLPEMTVVLPHHPRLRVTGGARSMPGVNVVK